MPPVAFIGRVSVAAFPGSPRRRGYQCKRYAGDRKELPESQPPATLPAEPENGWTRTMTLSTPLGRVFASILAILTITALIIAVAQVAAQESGGGSADGEEGTESGEVAEGDEGDRHTC